MGVIDRVHDATGADIIALYPCDGETGTFAAPVGIGLHADDLYHAVDDMAEQLARYRADSVQGRVPADLRPTHYGLSTWLLVTHRTFIAADAPREIGSTFVQRYDIRSTVALPLLVGGQTAALLMANWSAQATPPGGAEPTNQKMVASIETIAHDSAPLVTQARSAGRRSQPTVCLPICWKLCPFWRSTTLQGQSLAMGDLPLRPLHRYSRPSVLIVGYPFGPMSSVSSPMSFKLPLWMRRLSSCVLPPRRRPDVSPSWPRWGVPANSPAWIVTAVSHWRVDPRGLRPRRPNRRCVKCYPTPATLPWRLSRMTRTRWRTGNLARGQSRPSSLPLYSRRDTPAAPDHCGSYWRHSSQ